MDQIDRLDQIDPSCKFTPEDITVWQGNRTDGQWTTVTQLSRVGMVKLRAIKPGVRALEVLGAVARLENGDHCHIAHEYIKRTIDNCVMVKQSSSAKGTLAKQLTGIIAGYVLVEWAWDEREEWILPSQIEPIGSAKKRKSNPPNRFISGGSPNVQSMQLTYLKKKNSSSNMVKHVNHYVGIQMRKGRMRLCWTRPPHCHMYRMSSINYLRERVIFVNTLLNWYNCH